ALEVLLGEHAQLRSVRDHHDPAAELARGAYDEAVQQIELLRLLVAHVEHRIDARIRALFDPGRAVGGELGVVGRRGERGGAERGNGENEAKHVGSSRWRLSARPGGRASSVARTA